MVLICLVGSKRVVLALSILWLLAVGLLAVLLLLGCFGVATIVARMALRVARIICAERAACLTMLEPALAWRAVRVLPSWWTEFLCTVALLWLLLRVLVGVAVRLLRGVALWLTVLWLLRV